MGRASALPFLEHTMNDDDILKYIKDMHNPTVIGQAMSGAAPLPVFVNATGAVTPPPEDAGLKVDEMTEEELTVGMKDTLTEMEEFTRTLLKDLDAFSKHHKKAKISSSDLHSRLTELHSIIEQLILDAPDLLDSALYGNITNAAIDDLRKWIESEAQ